MQGTFGTVVWVVCALGIVAALATLFGKPWDDYGKGGLVMDRDRSDGPAAGSAAANAERDAEIRELLEARNARRIRRGEQPLDIDTEIARLTVPAFDEELLGEIRDLVHARNARRLRLGKPPLDVEAEVQREIAALSQLAG
jgi:hypothetical protein